MQHLAPDARILTATLTISLASLVAITGCNGSPAGVAVSTESPSGEIVTERWNAQGEANLALDGFDPVAYFPEGGGRPTQGHPAITHTTDAGITFRFASDDNRRRFIEEPGKYTPANGGWCAYCLTDGIAYAPSPESYLIRDDRLLLFYVDDSIDTRQKWLDEKDNPTGLDEAAKRWRALSDN